MHVVFVRSLSLCEQRGPSADVSGAPGRLVVRVPLRPLLCRVQDTPTSPTISRLPERLLLYPFRVGDVGTGTGGWSVDLSA